MELLRQERKSFVRILIGSAETRKSGIYAPTKTISLDNTSVQEVYEMIFDEIEKREKLIK